MKKTHLRLLTLICAYVKTCKISCISKLEPNQGSKHVISTFPWSAQYPTSLTRDPMWRAVRGVCSAGLMTTVFPQLSAGAIFHVNISKGKFHWHRHRKERKYSFSVAGSHSFTNPTATLKRLRLPRLSPLKSFSTGEFKSSTQGILQKLRTRHCPSTWQEKTLAGRNLVRNQATIVGRSR